MKSGNQAFAMVLNPARRILKDERKMMALSSWERVFFESMLFESY